MKFTDLLKQPNIFLYAGTMPVDRRAKIPFVGLMLQDRGSVPAHHIQHDITQPMSELPDNCVDIYQAEDVMEHIEYDNLPATIDEIYRVLKPGGLFRMSVPDYRCDVLYERTQKDSKGNLIFDASGGGRYDATNKRVVGGGHVWFPVYENTVAMLHRTKFSNIKVLHAYTSARHESNKSNELGVDRFVCDPIDYSKGYISRTPDHDKRVQSPRRPMSLVVDLIK